VVHVTGCALGVERRGQCFPSKAKGPGEPRARVGTRIPASERANGGPVRREAGKARREIASRVGQAPCSLNSIQSASSLLRARPDSLENALALTLAGNLPYVSVPRQARTRNAVVAAARIRISRAATRAILEAGSFRHEDLDQPSSSAGRMRRIWISTPSASRLEFASRPPKRERRPLLILSGQDERKLSLRSRILRVLNSRNARLTPDG